VSGLHVEYVCAEAKFAQVAAVRIARDVWDLIMKADMGKVLPGSRPAAEDRPANY